MGDPRKALGMEMSPPRIQAHFFFLKQDCTIDDEVDRAQKTHGPRFLDMVDEARDQQYRRRYQPRVPNFNIQCE